MGFCLSTELLSVVVEDAVEICTSFCSGLDTADL
jgi:hypothetical protein